MEEAWKELSAQQAVSVILATIAGEAAAAARHRGEESTALTMSALAGIMRDLKKPLESERLLRSGLELLETAADAEVLGAPSRELTKATVLNDLAFHYRQVGQHEEALQLYVRALDIRVPRLGKAHHQTITTRHNLAECLILMGKHEAAEEVQRGILLDLDVSAPTDHSQ